MIKLSEYPTGAPKNLNKDDIKKITKDLVAEIGELQNLIYAERKHSLLIIFQGMDGSGKDGITRSLFETCTPTGLRVYSFKIPSDLELSHDFLWRAHAQVPEHGEVVIFNRSHYEDILIQYVHGWIDSKKRDLRMSAINAFEELLINDNDTQIIKFFLHISPEKQVEKLQERIDDPKKRWKHNDGDWEERKLWTQYMEAYEYAINNSIVPWQIIPVDHQWYRDYLAAKCVRDTLKSFKMTYPPLNSKMFTAPK